MRFKWDWVNVNLWRAHGPSFIIEAIYNNRPYDPHWTTSVKCYSHVEIVGGPHPNDFEAKANAERLLKMMLTHYRDSAVKLLAEFFPEEVECVCNCHCAGVCKQPCDHCDCKE